MSPHVTAERHGALGLITLDRAEALNALDVGMIRAITAALQRFAADTRVAHVAVRSASARAFSAGGDLRALYREGMSARERGEPVPAAFFREEYRLNHLIHTFPKPYVALADGIVMGGGAGISVPGRYRVFGRNVRFAMPEVSIGFFPDVGATWFLPRLRDQAGRYLALTGLSIGLDDCLWCGLATHAMGDDGAEAIAAALAGSTDTAAVLERHAAPLGDGPSRLERTLGRLGPAFGAPDLAATIAGLEALAGTDDGAAAALSAMRAAAPLSLAIADRQMRLGATTDFAACLVTEYRIVNRVIQGYDIYEGIRVRLIDRTGSPAWRPDRLEAVDKREVRRHFEPLAEELDLT